MRTFGFIGARLNRGHLKKFKMSGGMLGKSVYSEQISKNGSNIPELTKSFGGLMKTKKQKKVYLRL